MKTIKLNSVKLFSILWMLFIMIVFVKIVPPTVIDGEVRMRLTWGFLTLYPLVTFWKMRKSGIFN